MTSLKSILGQTIQEGKFEEQRRKEMLENFDKQFSPKAKNAFPKSKSKKKKIDPKAIKALAKLYKKKLVAKRLLKKSKKPTLVVNVPRFVPEKRSMFFQKENIIMRRGV